MKYYLRDSADRDFRPEYDVKLEANVRFEVDEKVGKELKKKYPYLELISEK